MGKQKNKKNQKNAKQFGNTDCDSLSKQLRQLGFSVKEMLGDGNCLFRALGDQYEGHSKNHVQYRLKVVEYIKNNRSEFEPFMEDDVPFDEHVKSLAEPGTYGGNDAIVAFSRIYNVTVVIHQCDCPAWVIHPGNSVESKKELHISYHNGDHYNSVVRLNSGDISLIASSVSADSSGVVTRKSTGTSKVQGKLEKGKEEKKSESPSLPKLEELRISDDKENGSKDSQAKKNVPQSKAVKQTRRQKVDQKKKERKVEALQRKRDASSVPFISAITSTPPSVKTVNI